MNDMDSKFAVKSIGAVVILEKFLYHIQARISFSSVCNSVNLYSESSEFSLLEVKKILDDWGFDTYAGKVKLQALSKLNYPFISHIFDETTQSEEFILVEDFSNDFIKYSLSSGKEMEDHISKFNKLWGGAVLLATGNITESGYAEKKVADEVVKQKYLDDNIILIDKFLTDEECDFLIEYSINLFNRSKVVGFEDGKVRVSPHRTSHSAILRDLNTSFKDRIKEKCIRLLNGRPYNKFEEIQCVSYESDQEFKAHFDAGEKMKRLYTILIYLNDEIKGGETHFPLLNQSIKPKKGKAILFHNLTPDNTINIYSFHAGLPVRQGRKIACNIWIR